MQLVKLVIALAIVFALGGVLGVSVGNSSGLQAVVPQLAAVAQPQLAAGAQPQAAPQAAPAQVGMVGVLQALGSQSLSLQTKEGMQVLAVNNLPEKANGAPALGQLKVGDKLAVWTQIVNGRPVVTKIVVVPQSPQRVHYVGLISSIRADKLEVVGQQGETTTFRVDGTLQKLPDAARAPQVGDQVTVVAKPDPLGSGWLAVAVVKQ